MSNKSVGIAYLLWIVGFFGVLGFQRFYIGKIGTGVLWFFTGGLCGIGALIDLFTLGSQVKIANMDNTMQQTVKMQNMAQQQMMNNTMQQTMNMQNEMLKENKK